MSTLVRRQTVGEEIANSISHGLGLLAALVGTPLLIVHAVRRADAAFVVGVSIFCASCILLYLASLLYHSLPSGKGKRVFHVLDHSAIYLLIAGTYTPFTLGVLRGSWGWTLFGLVWGLAIIGVVLNAVARKSHPILSTGLYLLMGWLIVIAVNPMLTRVPLSGLLWLVAGGLCYTVGVVFYATDSRLHYGHFIWHLFVLAGTVCHFFAIYWYVA